MLHAMVEDWYFTSDHDGWRWHRVRRGGNVTDSSSCFTALLQCVEDAIKNGYVVGLATGTVHARTAAGPISRTPDSSVLPEQKSHT